jgi:hypothetical protein
MSPSLAPRAGGVRPTWSEGGPPAPRPALPGERRRVAVWGAVAALCVLAPVASLAALWVTAPDTEEVYARWQRAAGFEPLLAFPPREANDTAVRLEAVVRPHGLDLAPRDSPRRSRLHPGNTPWLAPLGDRARDVVRAMRVPRPQLVPADAPTTRRLAEALPALLAARDLLLAGEPRWELDLRDGWGADPPDLRAHPLLHKLLILAAHESARAGDAAAADSWLLAAWRLREALAREPLLDAQRVAIAELDDELTLLRALPASLPGWRQRLQRLPVRRGVEQAQHVDTWFALNMQRRYSTWVSAPDAWVQRVFRRFTWVVARHGAGHLVEASGHAMARARREGAGALQEGFVTAELARMPRWSRLPRKLLINQLDVPLRAARAQLATELTAQLLALRELPAGELPARRPSTVAGVEWLYTLEAGVLRIRASREVPSPAPRPLPLHAELPWPPTAAALEP